MRPALTLTVLMILLTTAPLAHAGPSATTVATAACALVDSDSCQETWASPNGAYFLSVAGSFEGTTTITVTSATNPFIAFTQTCTGTMVGIVMTTGGCWMTGIFPTGAIKVECASSGVGTAVCSVEGQ